MKFGGATWDELEQCHNMFKAPLSATVMQALCIAKVIMEIHNGVSEHGVSFCQNYTNQKGVKTFGEKGRKAARKELDQLHQRKCFTPIDVNELSPEEKAQAMEALQLCSCKKRKTEQQKGGWSAMVNQPVSGCPEKTRQAPLQLWKACSSQAQLMLKRSGM